MFNSQAFQDQFVANILQFKKNGYCIDIGSYHSIITNNTFYFQDLDWFSLSIESNSSLNDSYSTRKNGLHLNDDALLVNYSEVLKECEFPSVIDYLSLDVDTCSTEVLKILPFDEYKFRVITIEHDAYLYGDEYRNKQRQILSNYGYKLLCSNVLVPGTEDKKFYTEKSPFEDWWVFPDEFSDETLRKIECDMCYPDEIISKFV